MSAVPIPAEPRALRVAAAAGIDVGPIRAWCKALIEEPRYLVTLPAGARKEMANVVKATFAEFYPGAKVFVKTADVRIDPFGGTDPILEASMELLGTETAAGRVLSAANEAAISDAQKHCKDVMGHMAAVLDESNDSENPDASALSAKHKDRLGKATAKCQAAIDALQAVLDQVTAAAGDSDGSDDAEDPSAAAAQRVIAGVVPKNISTEKAPEGQAWEKPSLGDFTDKAWGDLSDDEKRSIAGHFAWAAAIPPETFGDLKFPHHDPKTHKVVWHGVINSLARLSNSSIPDADKSKVEAHLNSHKDAFGKSALTDLQSARQREIEMMDL